MILRPIATDAQLGDGCVPSWSVIQPTQSQAATELWVIMQTDHAALAGAVAAALSADWLPRLGPETVEAISIHDCGWSSIDAQEIRRACRERVLPRSFLHMTVAEFQVAWLSSIDKTAERSPLGGVLVSEHFSRLASYRLRTQHDAESEERQLREFVAAEQRRREHLAPLQSHSAGELAGLVDVLQFCDELSLYLCCGAERQVEFSQAFGGRKIRLSPAGDSPDRAPRRFTFSPSPLSGPIDLAVNATHWPCDAGPATVLYFLLQ